MRCDNACILCAFSELLSLNYGNARDLIERAEGCAPRKIKPWIVLERARVCEHEGGIERYAHRERIHAYTHTCEVM